LKRRAPGKVNFDLHTNSKEINVLISPTLFNWVLEKLNKNALDAIEGNGNISVNVEETPRNVSSM
jgi:C4-dicarboxylate-specific signal transduction histidine kinase